MSRFLNSRTGPALLSLFALAFSASQAKADIQTIRSADSEVWASAGTSLLNYQENIGAPNIPDSEHGWLPSLAAGASYLTGQNVYFALEGSVDVGDTHYNGSLFDSNTNNYDIPFQSTTHDVVTTVDGKVGKGIPLMYNIMLTPYGEVGYRYWHRDLGQQQVENYQNFDAQAGLMAQISPVKQLILTAYGSMGPTFASSMRTNGLTYDLGGSALFKVGAKVAYDLTPRVDIFTTLDYDSFRYSESPIQIDGSLEPSSKTEDTTIRVGVGYHFK